MLEVFQRDPPKKCHVVVSKPSDGKALTHCGHLFVELFKEIETIECRLDELPPVKQRCSHCDWEI